MHPFFCPHTLMALVIALPVVLIARLWIVQAWRKMRARRKR